MSFSPNRKKSIISLVVLVIVTLTVALIFSEFLCFATTPLCTASGCPPGTDPCSIFGSMGILFAIIGILFAGLPAFAVAYVILSLREKP